MTIEANTSEIAEKRPKTIYLETFGCQMNELDSELVRGHLKALGYRFTGDSDTADVVLYNTCSVREQAENKVWSRVGIMGLRKKEGGQFILGVIGCMAERDGADMIRRFPQVDLMCGPGELDKLPMLIDNACKTEAVQLADRIALQGSNSRRASTLEAVNDNLELLDLSRAFDPDLSSTGSGGRSAYVRITRGCNKFCTYCVVPYTRGAEVHRPPDSIVDECKKLADQGVIEITLLGQTVNHYIYTHGTAISAGGIELPQVGPGASAFARSDAKAQAIAGSINPKSEIQNRKSSRVTTFADLLKRIHDEVPAVQRLRFVTSFPRDFGDDILQVVADSPRICKYLHVPAQSGSNRILKLMNRGYTAEQYVEFIDRARAYLPGVCIAGDFIVGFPTETEDDFQLTCDLLRRVRYKNSFIFKYSPRPGTTAITRFEDDVPEPVKRRRNNQLLALQGEISAQVHAEFIGKTVNVFVEQITRRSQKNAAISPSASSRSPISITSPSTFAPSHASPQTALTISAKPPSAMNQIASPTVQMSGRTEGDLIAVFDAPADRADDLLGRLVPLRVTQAAPLVLHGDLGLNLPA